MLEYAARRLKQHGFTNIVFIGDSGPNQDGQNAVAAKLTADQDGTNGIQGDPRGSTPEIGRALLDKNIGRTVEMIKQSIAAR